MYHLINFKQVEAVLSHIISSVVTLTLFFLLLCDVLNIVYVSLVNI